VALNFSSLANAPKLLLEAELKPIQGVRFQPTGFPDLGPASYELSDSTPMLLVESPQSMANRMEAICWDEASNDLTPTLEGIPYVIINDMEGKFLSSSILEAHRLNSPYIMHSKDRTFFNILKKDLGVAERGRIDWSLLYRFLCRYDPNCLLHGVFLAQKEIAGGRYKLPRALSAFIEAKEVRSVPYGGVKLDDINPKKSEERSAKEGFGHVPFHREDYTGEITAYFNLDLAQIRGYRLDNAVEKMLIALSLFKILKFLDTGLRLRTACDLELNNGIKVTRPDGLVLPKLEEVEKELPSLIASCKNHFANPSQTKVVYVE
jgi:CRISPR-associated protein Csb1